MGSYGFDGMSDPRDLSPSQKLERQGKRLITTVWNGTEHRLRAPIRLVLGLLLLFILAGIGNEYRPTLVDGTGSLSTAVNMLTRQAPNAIGLALAVVVAAVVIDRRRLADLGLHTDRRWWWGLAGGLTIGGSIALVSIIVGVVSGYYEFVGLRLETGIGLWILLAVGGAVFQLLFVVPEEFFVRGYLITNVLEGFNGVSSVSVSLAAGVGIIISSAFFYLTHAGAKGLVFGSMVAVISVLLGLGYVLSGDLSVPIGIHFGLNFTSVLAGTNPQQASLLEFSATSTVEESLVLPVEALVVRCGATVVSIAVVCWWYHKVEDRLQVSPTIARPSLRHQQTHASSDD